MADVVIRIMDMAGYYGIDLEQAIIDKIKYNKTRPYKHGGKVI
jgi:NTP pyrophosphatase (non-canonical NTP hydrolase)